jgi:hypothetical protein
LDNEIDYISGEAEDTIGGYEQANQAESWRLLTAANLLKPLVYPGYGSRKELLADLTTQFS